MEEKKLFLAANKISSSKKTSIERRNVRATERKSVMFNELASLMISLWRSRQHKDAQRGFIQRKLAPREPSS